MLVAAAWMPAAACAHGDADDPPARRPAASETTSGAAAGGSGSSEVEAEEPTHAVDDAPPAWAVPAPPPEGLPRGRAIGDLDRRTCHRLLRDAGVRFEVVDGDEADGVALPILLEGPVGGIDIVHRNRRARRNSILDCRLAVALLAWSPTLRAASITSIEHFSIYRPGARVRSTGQPSGHAAGLAIDAGVFVRGDAALAVVERWTDHRRDVETCRPPEEGEPEDQLLLRRIVCAAVAADLFQVVVTPHGNEDHEDHVHLEVRPGVDWTDIS